MKTIDIHELSSVAGAVNYWVVHNQQELDALVASANRPRPRPGVPFMFRVFSAAVNGAAAGLGDGVLRLDYQ